MNCSKTRKIKLNTNHVIYLHLLWASYSSSMRDSGEALTLLSDDGLIREDQFLLTPWKQNRKTYSVGWVLMIGLGLQKAGDRDGHIWCALHQGLSSQEHGSSGCVNELLSM